MQEIYITKTKNIHQNFLYTYVKAFMYLQMIGAQIIPVCKDVLVADDPILPKDELPNGADGGAACKVGKRPEPTPWATPIGTHTEF